MKITEEHDRFEHAEHREGGKLGNNYARFFGYAYDSEKRLLCVSKDRGTVAAE